MVVIYLLISIILIIFLTSRLKIHPFIVLLLVAMAYGLASGMSLNMIIKSVNDGFGETLGKIGLIIVLGIMIGAFLENSGGAFTLAEKVLGIIGKKRVTLAMGIIGYIVSIPVFADSGFILLSPINKSLSKKSNISIAGTAMALALGLMATHTLVPPTPGPIAAAGILNADLGLVLIFGLIISALEMIPAMIFAKKYASRTYIDPEPEITDAEIDKKKKDAPGALKASLPVVVPILLILLKSLATSMKHDINGKIVELISFAGEPFVALMIGMFLALFLPKKLEKNMLSTSGWVGKALRDASTIILITGAGGIFGKVLQNSGIAQQLGGKLAGTDLGILLPFILAAAIKTAQGSSTVALITAASIMMPLMHTLGFDTGVQKALVVTAIGTGSAVFSHANDSFFWVVTQLSGMDVKTGYRIYSLGTFVLGVSGALFLYVLYSIIV